MNAIPWGCHRSGISLHSLMPTQPSVGPLVPRKYPFLRTRSVRRCRCSRLLGNRYLLASKMRTKGPSYCSPSIVTPPDGGGFPHNRLRWLSQRGNPRFFVHGAGRGFRRSRNLRPLTAWFGSSLPFILIRSYHRPRRPCTRRDTVFSEFTSPTILVACGKTNLHNPIRTAASSLQREGLVRRTAEGAIGLHPKIVTGIPIVTAGMRHDHPTGCRTTNGSCGVPGNG